MRLRFIALALLSNAFCEPTWGKQNREFESRRDLLLLFKESRILDVNPDLLNAKGLTDDQIQEHQKALRLSMNEVYLIWQNNYRFASEERLLAHFKNLSCTRERKATFSKRNPSTS